MLKKTAAPRIDTAHSAPSAVNSGVQVRRRRSHSTCRLNPSPSPCLKATQSPPRPTPSSSFDNAVNNTNATTANLRGFAVGSTLSLVNGRRMAPISYGGDFIIAVIPSGAIERVEVLTDGASAICGSDAIAGVVNFIVRDRYDGAETSVRYGDSAGSSCHEVKADQTFGHGWSSGNAMLSYEYFDRTSLVSSDRLSGRLDTLYTKRDGETQSGYLAEFIHDYGVRYLTVNPTLTYKLTQDWSAELSGVYGETQDRIVARIPPDVYPFGSDGGFRSADLTFNGSLFKLPGGARESFPGASSFSFNATKPAKAGDWLALRHAAKSEKDVMADLTLRALDAKTSATYGSVREFSGRELISRPSRA